MKSQSATIRIVNIPDFETRAEKILEHLKVHLIALRRKSLAKRDRKVPAKPCKSSPTSRHRQGASGPQPLTVNVGKLLFCWPPCG